MYFQGAAAEVLFDPSTSAEAAAKTRCCCHSLLLLLLLLVQLLLVLLLLLLLYHLVGWLRLQAYLLPQPLQLPLASFAAHLKEWVLLLLLLGLASQQKQVLLQQLLVLLQQLLALLSQ